MTNPCIVRTDENGLATLTLNRPDKLNAMNTEMFVLLGKHVADIAESATIGCVILRGAGKCFSAGHDLGAIDEGESGAQLNLQASVIERLANLPQPVISAVHGHCYTGALELALAGDLILASANARFADTHGRWGLTPIWGMSQRLPRRVGPHVARDLMFTCRTVESEEALRIGLVERRFEDASFDSDVRAVADAILANSWFSAAANKRLLVQTDGVPLAAGLAHETYRNEGHAPDVAARIAAFAKRKA